MPVTKPFRAPLETPCFKMIGERCAMLDGENLCQIYRRWGKEGLCQICRDHPLFTDTFGTRRETGLGLCCEEAARLLFTDRKPLTLYAADTSEPECPEEVETILVERMTAVRDRLFALLHDRTVPINLRLCQVLIEAQEAQWIWEEERWQALEQLLGRFEYALVAALCAAVALVLLSVMLPLLGVLSAVGG